MANVQRGEASFTASDGRVFYLVMDFNAFAEAEDAADLDIEALLQAVSPKVDASGNVIGKPRIKHLGALLYGGLQAKHPGLTHADAIRLLGEGEQVGEAIAKALRGAMPKQDESAEGKAETLGAGTGTKPKRTGRRKA